MRATAERLSLQAERGRPEFFFPMALSIIFVLLTPMLFRAQELGEIVTGHLSRKPHWLQSLGEERDLTLCSPSQCCLPHWWALQGGAALRGARSQTKYTLQRMDGFPWVLNCDYKVARFLSLSLSLLFFSLVFRIGPLIRSSSFRVRRAAHRGGWCLSHAFPCSGLGSLMGTASSSCMSGATLTPPWI